MLITNYAKVRSVVKEAIQNADPMGLLRFGAPVDEYDDEIQRIVAGLRSCNDENDLRILICHVFQDNFDETVGAEKVFVEFARCIWNGIV